MRILRILGIALAAILSPFAVLYGYIVVLLPTSFYNSHPGAAGNLGLALALGSGLAFLWPLRKGLRPIVIVLLTVAYLVFLTPCLMLFAIGTVCNVTGNRCM